MLVMLCCALVAKAEITANYEVTKECPELGLYKGDVVKVTIETPNRYDTPIYIVKFPATEFEMKPARGGMARFGESGYSSDYTIGDVRVHLYRSANSRYISITGKYQFELRRLNN